MARSSQAVAEHAKTLESATDANATTVTEIASSVEEVAATAEKNAAVIDANADAPSSSSRARPRSHAQSAQQISTLSASSAARRAQLETLDASASRRSSQAARENAERIGATAREGGATVGRSIAGLRDIRQAMVESSVVIKDMGKRAEEIGDIVQTINLIADRTNLLSLNASIEAARAGEHGRGFAVVAEEIRALADRAAAASADIAKIVRGLQSTARDAVQRHQRRPARSPTSACAWPATPSAGLAVGAERRRASSGVAVRDIDRASGEQVARDRAARRRARSASSEEGRSIAARRGRADQRHPVARSAGAAEMRSMARQTKEATAEQARALRDVVRANTPARRAAPRRCCARASEQATVGRRGRARRRHHACARSPSARVGAMSEQTKALGGVSASAQERSPARRSAR